MAGVGHREADEVVEVGRLDALMAERARDAHRSLQVADPPQESLG